MIELAFEARRQEMLAIIALHARQCADLIGKEQLSSAVLEAMARAPRHHFVPIDLQPYAYEDTPLPIGCGKTISQPFIVALMTDLLQLEASDKVLEVGAGLGYQAAVLAEICEEVCAIEIVSELAEEAERRLSEAGYENVRLRIGDGGRGWPEEAPFDKIIVSAAPHSIPATLVAQLKSGGRMVLPVGDEDSQYLHLVEKTAAGEARVRRLIPVRFSAMTLSH
ncbi:MAG: protein-L-isoaspartate(D-aspartate) O-methyltransferase [Parvularculaceae bacterium]